MSDVVNVGTLPDDGTGDPFRDAYIAINEALAPLLLHAIDRANPHAVTARQVGAYSKVETDELLRAALLGLPTLPNVAAAISTAIGALSLGTAASKNVGTSAGNVPVLDAQSKLLASILPALAITDVFPVASQAEMLALTAERGDVAVRSDLNKSFILRTEPATALGNWTELLTPTDQVTSVAGLTGAVSAAALKTALALVVGDVSGALARAGDQMTGALDFAARVTVPSAATTTIGASGSNNVEVSGTTTITAFDNYNAGALRWVLFSAAGLTLTHNATSLILPGAANIVTQAGDTALFRSHGTGWRCLMYARADGTSLVGSAGGSAGKLVDRAYAEYTTNTLISATIPVDDTIPQSNEGTQILTATLTPKSATNRIRIRFQGWASSNQAATLVAALFVGASANAAAASASGAPNNGGNPAPLVLEYEMVAGQTSALTFAIRVGSSVNNIAFNGNGSGRFFGGSSRATLVVEEITP